MNSYARLSAVHALGEINDTRAVEPLIQTLKDKNSDVRSSAKEALIDIGKPAVEPLIKALNYNDSNVRYQAASSLGEIRDSRAVEPLIQALKDNDSNVRSSAAEALGIIKTLKQ